MQLPLRVRVPVSHDAGISRLIPDAVKKGGWYLGFVCSKCGEKIPVLEDAQGGLPGQVASGNGSFSVPCRSCKTDAVIFKTADFKVIQADEDGPLPTARQRHAPSNRPRQPLSTRYRDAAPTFGPRFLEDRPECAIIVARCVSTWSYIETDLALLLAAVLKINTAPALAMFLAIQNSRTQFEVLKAAAEAVLSSSDFELFGALMNIKASIEKERNDLVHGLFGGSMLVESGVLWIEPRHNVSHTARVWASDFKENDGSHSYKNTFVYEPEDLETIAQRMEWFHKTIGFFRGYISSDNAVWRALRYPQLCAEPQIAKELSRIRDGLKKTSPAQKKQSPRERRREDRRSRGKS